MLKKVLSIFLYLLIGISLTGCQSEKQASATNQELEFPKLKWGTTEAEAKKIYKWDTKNSHEIIGKNSKVIKLETKRKLFGEPTGRIEFEFYNDGNDVYRLLDVTAYYTKEADVNKILNKMEKSYGISIKNEEQYGYLPFADKQTFGILSLPNNITTYNWKSKTISQTVSDKNQLQDLRKKLKKYYKGIDNEENWDTLINKVPLVKVFIATVEDDEQSPFQTKVVFDGSMLFITDQTSEE
ncbi:hypothetical protein [Velocimicrobium porci]|uniref:Lipoprotein n=1 Tax=Velocimicrobium porci TaxID=2606634 RepID=A0A6L5XXE9_9FIRM|nr:hypothetical protein [Velocimicrobium porci]MSS63422.1 hypothetical protein [Velocimicrobium porci]